MSTGSDDQFDFSSEEEPLETMPMEVGADDDPAIISESEASELAREIEPDEEGGAVAEADTSSKKKKKKEARSWNIQFDVYTAMLALALLFVTLACLALFLELQEYGPFPWWKTSNL